MLVKLRTHVEFGHSAAPFTTCSASWRQVYAVVLDNNLNRFVQCFTSTLNVQEHWHFKLLFQGARAYSYGV